MAALSRGDRVPYHDMDRRGQGGMRTAVVIPCYKVRRHILDVVQGVLPIVDRVYVIDDCCPEESGALVLAEIRDPKLKVIMHEENQGVGGAVVTGYRAVLS